MASKTNADRKSRKQKLGNDTATQKRQHLEHSFLNLLLKCLVIGPLLIIFLLGSLACVLPCEIEPVEITELSSPPALTGPLSANQILRQSEQMFKGKIDGPESFVINGEHIYTGTQDGWIYDLYKGEVRKFVTFAKEPCGDQNGDTPCGRPLGMRLERSGSLIVCDPDFGLLKVNIATGKYEELYATTTLVNGKASRFLNDLDIGLDGTIYFSDSSTKWNRHEMPFIFIEGAGTGRLLKYNPKTKATEMLMDGLIFANGVQMTIDYSAVLIAECGRSRIMKYDLKTRKASVWADNLPGCPDNIRFNKDSETYWVGCTMMRSAEKFSFIDFLAPRPWLRSIIGKVVNFGKTLGLGKYVKQVKLPGLAIEFDASGNITRTLQDPSGDVIGLTSEIQFSDGFMYIGSPKELYLGKLDQQYLLQK